MISFNKIITILENHQTRKRRLNYSKRALKQKLQAVQVSPLSKQQRTAIDMLWSKYFSLGKVEYKWFEFYHTLRQDDKIEQFIPNNIFFTYIDTYFNDFRASRAMDDKNIYDLLFMDVLQPKTVIHCIEGRILDEKYNVISFSEAELRCKKANQVIIKPAVGTEGGKGIVFWSKDDSVEILKNAICNKNVVVQEVLKQHKVLSELHPSSINTIRIMTLCWNNDVYVLSAVVRMGVNGSNVDNASSGGICCGINEDGSLKENAVDQKGKFFAAHPQGARFCDITIPQFDQCKDLVKSLAPRISRISKMVSWDLAINEMGNPVLIEANFSYGSVALHQMCNGPIFGELTEEILKKVFPKKKMFKW